jgi:hypothetical protein
MDHILSSEERTEFLEINELKDYTLLHNTELGLIKQICNEQIAIKLKLVAAQADTKRLDELAELFFTKKIYCVRGDNTVWGYKDDSGDHGPFPSLRGLLDHAFLNNETI